MHIHIYIYIPQDDEIGAKSLFFSDGEQLVVCCGTLYLLSPLDTHPHHPAPPPFFRGLRGSFSPRAGYHISLDVDDIIFRPPSPPPPIQRPTIVRSTYDARARRIGHNSIVEEEGAR